MPFARPTLTEVIERILADLSSRVVGVDGAVLRRSVLGVLGRGLAGSSHELHGHLEWIARQVIPDTADAEYLERWANIWLVRRRAAEFAIGQVTFTGNNGSIVPQGTVVRRQDGARFQTTAEASIAAGTATISAQALEAGAAGNALAGTALALLQPISGVQTNAVVAAGGMTNGSDTEDDDALRARLLDRIQSPPQGGAANDYIAWALAVPGVTRAWVYPMEVGAGTVTVRFVRDDDASIIPDAAEITAVYDYIEERRPVTAELFVLAPTAVPLNLLIQINPNTAAVQAAITAELGDLIRREAEPGGTILISHLREAVSTAAGEFDSIIVTPAANVDHATGEIAVLGELTFEPIP